MQHGCMILRETKLTNAHIRHTASDVILKEDRKKNYVSTSVTWWNIMGIYVLSFLFRRNDMTG